MAGGNHGWSGLTADEILSQCSPEYQEAVRTGERVCEKHGQRYNQVMSYCGECVRESFAAHTKAARLASERNG